MDFYKFNDVMCYGIEEINSGLTEADPIALKVYRDGGLYNLTLREKLIYFKSLFMIASTHYQNANYAATMLILEKASSLFAFKINSYFDLELRIAQIPVLCHLNNLAEAQICMVSAQSHFEFLSSHPILLTMMKDLEPENQELSSQVMQLPLRLLSSCCIFHLASENWYSVVYYHCIYAKYKLIFKPADLIDFVYLLFRIVIYCYKDKNLSQALYMLRVAQTLFEKDASLKTPIIETRLHSEFLQHYDILIKRAFVETFCKDLEPFKPPEPLILFSGPDFLYPHTPVFERAPKTEDDLMKISYRIEEHVIRLTQLTPHAKNGISGMVSSTIKQLKILKKVFHRRAMDEAATVEENTRSVEESEDEETEEAEEDEEEGAIGGANA